MRTEIYACGHARLRMYVCIRLLLKIIWQEGLAEWSINVLLYRPRVIAPFRCPMGLTCLSKYTHIYESIEERPQFKAVFLFSPVLPLNQNQERVCQLFHLMLLFTKFDVLVNKICVKEDIDSFNSSIFSPLIFAW